MKHNTDLHYQLFFRNLIKHTLGRDSSISTIIVSKLVAFLKPSGDPISSD